MANSIQTNGVKAETFNDLDLIVLVCLFDPEVTSVPDRYVALRTVIAGWKRGLTVYGPGTIDLELDDLASFEGERSQLISLLTAIDDKIDKFGETVPASLLNERCLVPGVTFRDYPTSLLKGAIKTIKTLLL